MSFHQYTKKKSWEEHLMVILSVIDRIDKQLTNANVKSYEEFKSQNEIYNIVDAIAINFVCLGEEIQHIKKPRAYYKHVPWDKITDMRNKIAHEYNDMDTRKLWDMVSRGNVLSLGRAVKEMLLQHYISKNDIVNIKDLIGKYDINISESTLKLSEKMRGVEVPCFLNAYVSDHSKMYLVVDLQNQAVISEALRSGDIKIESFDINDHENIKFEIKDYEYQIKEKMVVFASTISHITQRGEEVMDSLKNHFRPSMDTKKDKGWEKLDALKKDTMDHSQNQRNKITP